MDWTTIINPAITILAAGSVIKILTHQINAQKDQVNNLKTIIDAMKTQMDMINIDELDKYYQRVTANAVSDAVENIDAHALELTRNLLKYDTKSLKMTAEEWENNAMMSKYVELAVGLAKILKKIPKEKRHEYIQRQFPQNADLLWPIIEKSIA